MIPETREGLLAFLPIAITLVAAVVPYVLLLTLTSKTFEVWFSRRHGDLWWITPLSGFLGLIWPVSITIGSSLVLIAWLAYKLLPQRWWVIINLSSHMIEIATGPTSLPLLESSQRALGPFWSYREAWTVAEREMFQMQQTDVS